MSSDLGSHGSPMSHKTDIRQSVKIRFTGKITALDSAVVKTQNLLSLHGPS